MNRLACYNAAVRKELLTYLLVNALFVVALSSKYWFHKSQSTINMLSINYDQPLVSDFAWFPWSAPSSPQSGQSVLWADPDPDPVNTWCEISSKLSCRGGIPIGWTIWNWKHHSPVPVSCPQLPRPPGIDLWSVVEKFSWGHWPMAKDFWWQKSCFCTMLSWISDCTISNVTLSPSFLDAACK